MRGFRGKTGLSICGKARCAGNATALRFLLRMKTWPPGSMRGLRRANTASCWTCGCRVFRLTGAVFTGIRSPAACLCRPIRLRANGFGFRKRVCLRGRLLVLVLLFILCCMRTVLICLVSVLCLVLAGGSFFFLTMLLVVRVFCLVLHILRWRVELRG